MNTNAVVVLLKALAVMDVDLQNSRWPLWRDGFSVPDSALLRALHTSVRV